MADVQLLEDYRARCYAWFLERTENAMLASKLADAALRNMRSLLRA